MNAVPMIDMAEVTRLTRAGRLAEATALLQGLSRATETAAVPVSGAIDFARASDAGTWHMPGGVAGSDGAGGTVPNQPIGSSFEQRSFTNAAGSRSYKLFVPSVSRTGPLPLVVMLHGCMQAPDDFAAGTRMNELAQERGYVVAYPAQSPSANSSRCWNWFNAAEQARDKGEPSIIAGITRQIIGDVGIDPRRVYIAGFSAGGAAAATMAALYPDLYAAVCVHSGLACGAAKDMMSAFGAMQSGGGGASKSSDQALVPTIVFHGDRDTTVNAVNGDQVIAQAKGRSTYRATVERGQGPHGTTYTRTVETDRTEAPVFEHWVLHGAGHGWSGGSPAGSFTEPNGVDASSEMLRFFGEHPKRDAV